MGIKALVILVSYVITKIDNNQHFTRCTGNYGTIHRLPFIYNISKYH